MKLHLQRGLLAVAVFLLVSHVAWAQLSTPYRADEGLPTGTQVAKDSLGSDVVLTSMAATVTTLDPFGTSTVNLETGKGDLWTYDFYSPSKHKVIGVRVVNAPLLGGFRGTGVTDSNNIGSSQTLELDMSGQYAGSDKVYDRVKTDTAFIRFRQQFPGVEPDSLMLGGRVPPSSVLSGVDHSQPFWTIVWDRGSDSGMVCVVASKTGESFCMRSGTIQTAVPQSRGGVEAASVSVSPNPANGRVRVTVAVPPGAHRTGSELVLYNERGDRVLDLTASFAGTGYEHAEFDGAALPEGAYFCRATGSNWSGTTSVVVTR